MDLIKPNVKRRKHFDVSLCVICNEDLGSPNESNFVNNPTSEGLRSLIEACNIRADDVVSLILSDQDDILSKKNYFAFAQHVMRCRLMVSVWCQSHIPCPKLANPIGNGWKLGNNNALEPVMYKKDAAPIEVRDLTHLYCSDKDCAVTKNCPCLQNGLYCIEICACQGDCQNSNHFENSDSECEN